MKKSILNLGKALSKTAQKSVTGGFSDPDGKKPLGSLCNSRGPAKNRCAPGLKCDAGHSTIGVCVSAASIRVEEAPRVWEEASGRDR